MESGCECGKWRLANWLSGGSNKLQQSGLIRARLDRITGTKLLVASSEYDGPRRGDSLSRYF